MDVEDDGFDAQDDAPQNLDCEAEKGEPTKSRPPRKRAAPPAATPAATKSRAEPNRRKRKAGPEPNGEDQQDKPSDNPIVFSDGIILTLVALDMIPEDGGLSAIQQEDSYKTWKGRRTNEEMGISDEIFMANQYSALKKLVAFAEAPVDFEEEPPVIQFWKSQAKASKTIVEQCQGKLNSVKKRKQQSAIVAACVANTIMELPNVLVTAKAFQGVCDALAAAVIDADSAQTLIQAVEEKGFIIPAAGFFRLVVGKLMELVKIQEFEGFAKCFLPPHTVVHWLAMMDKTSGKPEHTSASLVLENILRGMCKDLPSRSPMKSTTAQNLSCLVGQLGKFVQGGNVVLSEKDSHQVTALWHVLAAVYGKEDAFAASQSISEIEEANGPDHHHHFFVVLKSTSTGSKNLLELKKAISKSLQKAEGEQALLRLKSDMLGDANELQSSGQNALERVSLWKKHWETIQELKQKGINDGELQECWAKASQILAGMHINQELLPLLADVATNLKEKLPHAASEWTKWTIPVLRDSFPANHPLFQCHDFLLVAVKFIIGEGNPNADTGAQLCSEWGKLKSSFEELASREEDKKVLDDFHKALSTMISSSFTVESDEMVKKIQKCMQQLIDCDDLVPDQSMFPYAECEKAMRLCTALPDDRAEHLRDIAEAATNFMTLCQHGVAYKDACAKHGIQIATRPSKEVKEMYKSLAAARGSVHGYFRKHKLADVCEKLIGTDNAKRTEELMKTCSNIIKCVEDLWDAELSQGMEKVLDEACKRVDESAKKIPKYEEVSVEEFRKQVTYHQLAENSGTLRQTIDAVIHCAKLANLSVASIVDPVALVAL